MSDLTICGVVQVCLAFGLVGLFWPERLMPLFQVLLFPWNATYRTIRANSLAAIGLSVLLLAHLSTLMN